MYRDKFDISIIYAARYRGINVDTVHAHDSLFQLYILNNDRLELFDGEASYIPDHLSEIVFIKPAEEHCLRLVEPAESQDWLDDDINCLFDCKFSVSDHELYKSLIKLPRILKVTDIYFFRRLAEAILKYLANEEKNAAETIMSVFMHSLLDEINPCDSVKEPFFYTSNTNFYDDMTGINGIKKYIDLNYTKQINLDELIKISCMNKNALCREFRRTYKDSPIHYILRKRVDEAKIYLTESSIKISELSERLGFSSASYFNRIFKRFEGISPTEYREKYCSISIKR